MKLIWKGPPTAVEIYPDPAPADVAPLLPLFSGAVAPERAFEVEGVDPSHPQIAGWLAFGLVALAEDETQRRRGGKKESIDG